MRGIGKAGILQRSMVTGSVQSASTINLAEIRTAEGVGIQNHRATKGRPLVKKAIAETMEVQAMVIQTMARALARVLE